jgi:hypothetical protein
LTLLAGLPDRVAVLFRLGGQSRCRQARRVNELPARRIIWDPFPGKLVEIAADAEFHGRTLQRIAERGLEPVPFVVLSGRAAHVNLRDPFRPEPDAKGTSNRTIRKASVGVLPSVDADYGIKPFLYCSGVKVGDCKTR